VPLRGIKGPRIMLIYSQCIYIHIAELIALQEIKSAMDIAMNWETQAVKSHLSHFPHNS